MNTTAVNVSHRHQIAYWMLACCALIFAMVVLGGVTRLTGSGLSMVEWKPVFGILPPLNQETWEALFEKYRQTAEYQKINLDMDLAGFKGIFWLEYFHRLLGRLIGFVFIVPLLFFMATRRIERLLVPKLITVFILGGLQGLLGWYMVKSGLVDNPHVSQYRLAAHLMFAVVLYGYILWVALSLLAPQSSLAGQDGLHGLRRFTYFVAVLIMVTMASGAFVAGLKAGLAYNTFPLMEGRWVPDGLFGLQPWFLNLFENTATVQFDHRLLASCVMLSIMGLWMAARRLSLPKRLRYGLHALLLAGLLQVGLGISTLLLHVPVALAAAHQAGALLVFTVVLFLSHQLYGLGARKRSA
jgi:cytochrome c oxidase assembly protein subunit 15